ncbi:melatonin receptor type 1B-like [Lineus longissimus]|uniref:melatonin receptor type 1B-like n=1 Tax=Lineus longissimus TaxID=88925 RepID=UPI00315D75BF
MSSTQLPKLLISATPSMNFSFHTTTDWFDTNGTTPIDPNSIKPSRLSTAITAIVMSLVVLGGIIGTFWIMWAVLRRKNMRGVIVNVFIISLCVNDLLNCFNQVFVIISYVALEWITGDRLCGIVPEFSMFLAGAALWHHAFIAIHRYLVVCHNRTYKRMSKTWYILSVLVVTRVIPACLVIPAFVIDMSIYIPKLLRCVFSPKYGARTIAVVVTLILVPFTIVSFCFSMIFCYIHRMSRNSRIRDRSAQHEIQITKMFGVVFIVFVIGFVPYGFIRIGDKDGRLSPDVYVIITALYAIASAINPVLYGTMNKSIRSACIDVLCCPSCVKENLRVQEESTAGNGTISMYLRANNDQEHRTSVSLLSRSSACGD